ncbi:MAG: hypothetical protein LLF94_04775 [Chlamydiales bacterium]|nr:hypothetical protein [Chlamydiales bacterium]
MTYTVSSAALGLDAVSRFLSWPTNMVVKKNYQAPIWTTKYILASHYTIHTSASQRLCKEISDAKWSKVGHVAARVIWAASVVLPVLDALAWCIKQLAGLDSVMRKHYEVDARHIVDHQKEAAQEALGNSVREMAGFIQETSCKESQEENEGLTSLRNKRYNTFAAHFPSHSPKVALQKCVKNILDLLSKTEHKDNLVTSMESIFQHMDEHLATNASCEWLKHEDASALHADVEALLTGYQAFYDLCTHA